MVFDSEIEWNRHTVNTRNVAVFQRVEKDLAINTAWPADFYISVALVYAYTHMQTLTYTCGHSYTQTPAHIHLLSRQPWSNSDMIVVLIRTCIEFLIRKPFLIVKRLLLLPSVELESRHRGSVAGDPYRQEVRKNHLGAKGAEYVLLVAKNTPCAACHRNHMH